MKIAFPKLAIPPLVIPAGLLLNVNLLGLGLVIPPTDVQLWGEIVLLKEFVLFDTDDIAQALLGTIANVVEWAFRGLVDQLNEAAKRYYDEHGDEVQ